MVNIEDFSKIELKVGTVLECSAIEGSDKLLKLQVDLGEDTPRQILSGIKQWYQPKDLIGKQFVFVTNLEPRILMELESQGMILAADPSTSSGQVKPIPIKPIKKVPPGTKLR